MLFFESILLHLVYPSAAKPYDNLPKMLVISCKKPQKVYTKFSLIDLMRSILLVVVSLLGATLPGSLSEVSTSPKRSW